MQLMVVREVYEGMDKPEDSFVGFKKEIHLCEIIEDCITILL